MSTGYSNMPFAGGGEGEADGRRRVGEGEAVALDREGLGGYELFSFHLPGPGSGHTGPSSGHAGPGSSHAGPRSGHSGPISGHAGPHSGYAGHGSGHSGPDNGHAGPGSGHAGPSSGSSSKKNSTDVSRSQDSSTGENKNLRLDIFYRIGKNKNN